MSVSGSLILANAGLTALTGNPSTLMNNLLSANSPQVPGSLSALTAQPVSQINTLLNGSSLLSPQTQTSFLQNALGIGSNLNLFG